MWEITAAAKLRAVIRTCRTGPRDVTEDSDVTAASAPTAAQQDVLTSCPNFRIYWKEKLNILENEFALQMLDPAHVSMRLPLAACKVSLAQRMETVSSEFPCDRNRLKVSLSNPNIKQFALLWGIAKQFPGKASRRPERFQEVTGSHYVKLHIYRTCSRLVTIFSSDPQSECK